jgi:hypothetical protein
MPRGVKCRKESVNKRKSFKHFPALFAFNNQPELQQVTVLISILGGLLNLILSSSKLDFTIQGTFPRPLPIGLKAS